MQMRMIQHPQKDYSYFGPMIPMLYRIGMFSGELALLAYVDFKRTLVRNELLKEPQAFYVCG